MPTDKRLQFETTIAAPVDKVWTFMIGKDTYGQWTSEFAEGTFFEGLWEEGERINFLAPSGDGMASEIAEVRPHEFISIRHIGYVYGGVEDTDSPEILAWAPAYENYTFRPVAGGTHLIIDQDVTDEYEEFMSETWPKALLKLKQLCEAP
jgi:uncharacterized protein YndB with AHSA1/START domain